jgi:hypothetical protein
MSITITQLLAERDEIRLFGRRLSDLQPRGDLGLALDPDGPVGFALISRVLRRGCLIHLTPPRLLSVYGDGVPAPAGDDGSSPERMWRCSGADPVLTLQIERGTLDQVLPG